MTIPSRPAPPPPNASSRAASSLSSSSSSSSTSSNYQTFNQWPNDNPFDDINNRWNPGPDHQSNTNVTIKQRPPRPPPPKKCDVVSNTLMPAPASVNILSNLFGRHKSRQSQSGPNLSKSQSKSKIALPRPPVAASVNLTFDSTEPKSTTTELINFDSPPHSPTFTQQSNSDCMSIGSFGSDSTSSPFGNTSQAESGFEDDFATSSNAAAAWNSMADDPFSPKYDESKNLSQLRPVQIGSSAFYTMGAKNSKTSQQPIDFLDPLCNGKSLYTIPVLSMPTIIKPNKPAQSFIKPKV